MKKTKTSITDGQRVGRRLPPPPEQERDAEIIEQAFLFIVARTSGGTAENPFGRIIPDRKRLVHIATQLQLLCSEIVLDRKNFPGAQANDVERAEE